MAMNMIQKRFMSSSALQKWIYNLSGFNRVGLWRDDLLLETPEVKEALRRLPEYVIDERNYRIIRAAQLSLEHRILPKDQWTKLEDDKLYLTPLVNDVIKEKEERKQWENNH
ncbi:cytochrome b-c1 complex subunit 7-like [Cylas formicarius]|uniref:cytochrome b-c1 complex subunit 7-like n=1 Tax=Cylas formicarius TaxID=197179 RepID=UPI002958B5EA|nr:cytochrome b-c1 complex subunit 7-like [Cylas formicarius]